MSTIRDVAEAAGVSPATVSRVLNGKASVLVSEGTRERVLEAAETLGYHPSAAARALVAGRTDTIALATTDIHDPHYTRALDLARRLADQFGYHLLLMPDAHDMRLKSLLRERRVDVIIRLRYPVDSADDVAAAAVCDEQTVIAIGPVEAHPPALTPCAYWDDREGIAAAVAHLAELGHRRIAFLSATTSRRKQQYALEAAPAGMTVIPVQVAPDDSDDIWHGARLARRALQDEPSVTALLAQNDTFALGALHALRMDGIAVPRQISVVGYNDIIMGGYCFPSLTTVRTPLAECVSLMLQTVLEIMSAQSTPHVPVAPQAVRFDTRLIARASTACPHRT
jgi:LacI family transcriptional regulator